MLTKIFNDIHDTNAWASKETVSGGGSELKRTVEIRNSFKHALDEFGIQSFLDAGCGDWNWMSKLDLSDYEVYACDIVPTLVLKNESLYSERARFFMADLTRDPLPQVDMILCRATLFHLSFENIQLALANMKRSARYLLLTTHPSVVENEDIKDGDWRRLNMQIAPFNLGQYESMFRDGPGNDGYMALWKVV